MITDLTRQDLVDFENDILEEFEAGHIRSPVHLQGGNEDQLIEIFQDIRENDWVICDWRSHLQCLLKGWPAKELKQKILDNHSISLCSKKYKIISSAIVGDSTPLALGLAWAAKEQAKDEHVFMFSGEMSATTGIFWESWNYAVNFDLPITFIVADNDRSVCTKTSEVWNYKQHPIEGKEKVIYYRYEPKFVHAGGGKRINL